MIITLVLWGKYSVLLGICTLESDWFYILILLIIWLWICHLTLFVSQFPFRGVLRSKSRYGVHNKTSTSVSDYYSWNQEGKWYVISHIAESSRTLMWLHVYSPHYNYLPLMPVSTKKYGNRYLILQMWVIFVVIIFSTIGSSNHRPDKTLYE
jgi:hypothetical protein